MTLVDEEELEQLRLTHRRFAWLLQFWSLSTGDSAASGIELIDRALSGGHTPQELAGVANAINRTRADKRRRRGHYRGNGTPRNGGLI
jgi:hypothetical protein